MVHSRGQEIALLMLLLCHYAELELGVPREELRGNEGLRRDELVQDAWFYLGNCKRECAGVASRLRLRLRAEFDLHAQRSLGGCLRRKEKRSYKVK
jgi:hypothetical protein